MTDITINATAGGRIASSNATYLTARSGSGLSASNAATSGDIGQSETGGTFTVVEGFLEFDLSSISGLTPTAVALRLYADSVNDSDYGLIVSTRDWGGGTLTTGDYVAGASLGGLTEVATLASSLVSAGGNEYFTLTNTGGNLLAALGGATLRVVLATDEEADGTPPGTGESRRFTGTGLVAGSTPAQLIVTVPAGYPKVMFF